MKKHPLLCLAGLLLLLLCLAGPVGAQTTAFTYQGRLTEGGVSANGRYDLIFQIFDAAAAGSSIGGAVGTTGVPVSNGLFTVRLDLGGTPFTGSRRWLQIQVSTNGAGNYTTLVPRQELTPAPSAIYANTAGTVTNGGITSAQLAVNAVATASLQNNSVTAGKIASGQVVKSLNGLTDAVSLTQGANVTINTVGNSLQISAPAGGLTLPYTGSGSSASQLFSLTNTGSGSAIYGKSTTTGNEGKLVTSLEGVYGASAATYGSGVGGYYYGANGVGVHGEHVQSGNYGELGYPSRGVFGRAAQATHVGVDGTHAPSGNYGYMGTADAGVYGRHAASGDYGALGSASGYGVFGQADTAGGRGVAGTATSTAADSVGVKGVHSPSGNYGQLGTSSAGVFGSSANSAAAVSAYTSGTGIPVRAQSANSYALLYLQQDSPSEPCRVTMTCATTGNAWNITTDNPAITGQNSMRFNNGSDRVRFDPNGNIFAQAFNPSSDRNLKQDFTHIRPRELLEKVVALPITKWVFKEEESVQHIGPMAQDFHAAFGLGSDDKHIATVDADGVALAAIQGLNQKLEQELKAKDAEIQALHRSVMELKQVVGKLAAQQNGGAR